jgi:alpha-tubulin suppressor-like RCC1 family protein
LTNDGRVFQWGDLINSAIPTQLSFGAGVTIASIYGCSARGVALSGTQDRAATFAAVDTNGKIYLWGNNIWGQCGTGNATTPVTTPTTPTALANKVITKVSFSASLGIHVGAIDSTGQLYMWGYGGNVSGCTPLGTGVGATNYNTPQAISGMTNVTDVVCASCYDNTWSRNITRILRADGSSWACGTNSSGELADSTLSNRAVFVREALSKTNIVAIYAGAVANGAMTAIVDSNGILYLSGKNHDQCFGDNTASGNAHTSFGNNATMSSAGFQGKMLNNTGIKPKICVTGDVYNGYCTMGILDNTGTFYVAGFNSQGQCGVGNTTQVATWTKPLLPAGKVVYDFTTHGYTSTDMGFTVACTDGSMYSWGGTTAGGVLGVESVNLGVNFTIPVPVIGFE